MLDFSSVLLIVALLYVFWVGPVLVFLNWLLTRWLVNDRSQASVIVSNIIVSLLLLGPVKSPGDGFVFRESYNPWYFGGSPDLLSWMGLVLIAFVSLLTTMISLSRVKPAEVHENDHSADS